MRRTRLALLVAAAAAVLAPGAAGHAGHAPVTVSIGNLDFTPSAVQARVGDEVTWSWDGSARDHSVTALPGQAEAFDSDPGTFPSFDSHPRGSTFSHTFTRAGRFGYVCKVHPEMRGAVNVLAAGAPDTLRPQITRARLRPSRVCPRRTERCRTTRTRVRFGISEEANLVVRVERRIRPGVYRTRRRRTEAVRTGRVSVPVPVRGLSPGRYRVSLRARDDAGNRSRVVRLGLVVRRP